MEVILHNVRVFSYGLIFANKLHIIADISILLHVNQKTFYRNSRIEPFYEFPFCKIWEQKLEGRNVVSTTGARDQLAKMTQTSVRKFKC